MANKELYLIKEMPREAPFQHWLVTNRKARKTHRCNQCQGLITKGQEYYELVFGGSGLGGLKFPTRLHMDCLEDYLSAGKPASHPKGQEREK